MLLENEYSARFRDILIPLTAELEKLLNRILIDIEKIERIDRITARPKSILSFIRKANIFENEVKKYSDPLNEIQDQIGARVIVFYKSDVENVGLKIKKYLREIEEKEKKPEKDNEFGYFGKHFIFLVPDSLASYKKDNKNYPKVFELQIKTLYQHSWSESAHDLFYRPEKEFSCDFKRKIAFTAAQSWGADMIFQELFESELESESQ